MAEEDKHSFDDGFISEGAIKSLNCEIVAKEKMIKHQHDEGRWALLKSGSIDSRNNGLYDRPLPCFGCGIGWFLFVLGFGFPVLWYIATALFLAKYQLRDPREREGLAAASIAALICTVAAFITLFAVFM